MRPALPLLASLALGCAAIPAPVEATTPAPVLAATTPMPSPTPTPATDLALTFPEGWRTSPPDGRRRLTARATFDGARDVEARAYRVEDAGTLEALRKALASAEPGVDGFRDGGEAFVRRVDDVTLDGTPGRRAWTVTRATTAPEGDLLRLEVVAFRGDAGYWVIFTARTDGDEHVARAFAMEAMGIAETWRWVKP